MSSTCSVLVQEVPAGAVNLGTLITKDDGTQYYIFWAENNIDALAPEEIGGYYAWGEIETKDHYDYDNYKWRGAYGMTKYNPQTDGKTILDPEDDVSTVRLGGRWRTPLPIEFKALYTQCEWIWTTRNEIKGFEVKSKVEGNNNSIFLPSVYYPADAYESHDRYRGFYLSSALWENATYNNGGANFLALTFYRVPDDAPAEYAEKNNLLIYDEVKSRSGGYLVRPVSE